MKRSAMACGAVCAAALCASPVTADERNELAPLARCTEADAAIVTRVDSVAATPGDAFTFKIVERVAAHGTYPVIPVGTRGFGVVAYADHAHGRGQPGRLVVEPRFLQLAGGRRIPAMADPQLAEGFVEGQTRNLHGALALVPGVGLAVLGYNALHRGSEVTLDPGTPFRVVIGDELALGECFVPSPSTLNVR